MAIPGYMALARDSASAEEKTVLVLRVRERRIRWRGEGRDDTSVSVKRWSSACVKFQVGPGPLRGLSEFLWPVLPRSTREGHLESRIGIPTPQKQKIILPILALLEGSYFYQARQ
eukprot:3829064-Rhodomonas_salina.2